MNQSSLRLSIVTAVLTSVFTGTAFAQVAAPVITKSFSPAVIQLNENSVATITVTNPNPALPLNNVQFSDTMPAGVDLITQTGGTCGTAATGGGMFTISPATESFSSTSVVLAGGQSCTITVLVAGIAFGTHINTTSQVTAGNAPPGPAASGTLTVVGGAAQTGVPTLSTWMLMTFAAALAGAAAIKLRA